MTTNALKNCRYCNSDDIVLKKVSDKEIIKHSVTCNGCCACGPSNVDVDEACNIWNKYNANDFFPTHQHLKRGTLYQVYTQKGILQTLKPVHDEAEIVVYAGDDGKIWARPVNEFNDGRFKALK